MSTANDPDDDPPVLRLKDVAKEFGVTTRTIERWYLSGLLVADVRTLGGHRRFRRSTVNLLKEGLRQAGVRPRRPFGRLGDVHTMDDGQGGPDDEGPPTEVTHAVYMDGFTPRRPPRPARAGETLLIERARAAQRRREVRQKARARQDKLVVLAERYFQRLFGMTLSQFRKGLRQAPLSTIAAKAGLTEAALRKACKRYGLATKPRGYWQKKSRCGA